MDMHSKEPWSVAEDDGRISIICGDTLAKMVFGPDAETAPANARRIVACVNICSGIDTESLESQLNLFDAEADAVSKIAKQLEALTATKFEALPTDGLVWVCLNAEGMPKAGIREHLESLSCVLTKAKVDGKTSAQFILTASLWPGQMQIQALPDEELGRIGLVRDYVAKGLREEALCALESLFNATTSYCTGGFNQAADAAHADAAAVIAKARGAV